MQSRLPSDSKILFISDVHFGAFSKARHRRIEQALIKLVDFAEARSYRLVILGDLFDYWIEYPNYTPDLGKNILARFRELHQHAQATLFITGNHDNWTLGHFSDLGFDVEPDARILHINKQKVLLLHGDATGRDINNLQRPLLHRVIRNGTFLKIYRGLLSPRAGLSVMKNFSKLSRMLGEEKADAEELDKWAEKILQTHDVDIILCGHDHIPRRNNYNYGTYLNLGTFHLHQSLVEYNNGHFSLVKWNTQKSKLDPFQPQEATHE